MILYVQTSNDPARQYSPLVLAQSAKAMDLNPTVYFLAMGLTMVILGLATLFTYLRHTQPPDPGP